MHRLRKINWKRGGGELVGFSISIMFLSIIFVLFLYIVELGLAKVAVEEAVYLSARSAVVCDNYQEGREAAYKRAKEALTNSAIGLNLDKLEVDIEVVSGTAYDSGEPQWEKGALLKCNVRVPLVGTGRDNMSSVSSSIFMMIERPAPQLGGEVLP